MSNFINNIKEMNGAYLIAEIGINHNGDLNVAKKLIDATNACGWHCAKFQKSTDAIVGVCCGFYIQTVPGLEKEVVESNVAFPLNIEKLSKDDIHNFEMNNKMTRLRLHESPKRKEIRTMLCNAESHTLSKIINTQRFYLRDLKLSIENNGAFHLPVLFC